MLQRRGEMMLLLVVALVAPSLCQTPAATTSNWETTQQQTTRTTSHLQTTRWERTHQPDTTATSRLLTTLMRTTTSLPDGPGDGGPGDGGPGGDGGCGSGSLVVKLEGKDVKLELDLRVNPSREKTDEARSSGELQETFRGVFRETEQKMKSDVEAIVARMKAEDDKIKL